MTDDESPTDRDDATGEGEPTDSDDSAGDETPPDPDDSAGDETPPDPDDSTGGEGPAAKSTGGEGLEASSSAADRRRTGRPTLFESIAGRLRADPFLWLPFFVAGLVLLAADLLRSRDPVPVVSGIGDSTIHVSYSVFPTGTAATVRPIGALVDLQVSLLGYALGIEIVAVAAIALAGWLTMGRASGEPFHPRRFLVYGGGLFLAAVLVRSPDTIGIEYTTGSLLVGLALLALAFAVFVRLFLVPVIVLREGGVLRPLGASWRYARGNGFTLFAVLVVVGIISWTLAHVPLVGTAASTTIAGTVHAVSLVVLYERCADSSESATRD